jgi:hypothetical protein
MLLYDTAGKMVPPGRIEKSWAAQWDTAGLPSWLTTPTDTGATVAYGDPATTNGYIELGTGATTGNTTYLKTIPFDGSKCAAIEVTAQGLYCSADTVQIELGCWENTAKNGGRVRQRGGSGGANDATVELYRTSGGSLITSVTDLNLVTNGEATKRRDLTFLLFPKTKWVYVLEADQVMYALRETRMTLTSGMFAFLAVSTRTDAAKWMRCEKLTVRRWYP